MNKEPVLARAWAFLFIKTELNRDNASHCSVVNWLTPLLRGLRGAATVGLIIHPNLGILGLDCRDKPFVEQEANKSRHLSTFPIRLPNSTKYGNVAGFEGKKGLRL